MAITDKFNTIQAQRDSGVLLNTETPDVPAEYPPYTKEDYRMHLRLEYGTP